MSTWRLFCQDMKYIFHEIYKLIPEEKARRFEDDWRHWMWQNNVAFHYIILCYKLHRYITCDNNEIDFKNRMSHLFWKRVNFMIWHFAEHTIHPKNNRKSFNECPFCLIYLISWNSLIVLFISIRLVVISLLFLVWLEIFLFF